MPHLFNTWPFPSTVKNFIDRHNWSRCTQYDLVTTPIADTCWHSSLWPLRFQSTKGSTPGSRIYIVFSSLRVQQSSKCSFTFAVFVTGLLFWSFLSSVSLFTWLIHPFPPIWTRIKCQIHSAVSLTKHWHSCDFSLYLTWIRWDFILPYHIFQVQHFCSKQHVLL